MCILYKLQQVIKRIILFPSKGKLMIERIEQLEQEIDLLKKEQCNKINILNESINFLKSEAYFDHCNLLGSIRPIIWGDADKVHISDKAAVFTCLLNVNSGEINIGDYTFAGSRVSILAGSHDMSLTGFLRRDAEMTEGYDINIGKGVWLGSGCTILGPSTIDDNAVIAAGSVVMPNTHVEENSVYGGVPAKFIKKIDIVRDFDIENPHIQAALERNNGELCIDGWKEKEWKYIGEDEYLVHRMNKDKSRLITINSSFIIYAESRSDDPDSIQIEIYKNKILYKTIEVINKTQDVCVELENKDKDLVDIEIRNNTNNDFNVYIVHELKKNY